MSTIDELEMSVEGSALERLLKRDRQVVLVALMAVTLLAWVYTAVGVGMPMTMMDMTFALPSHMPDAIGAVPDMVSVSYVLILLAMWWIMMVAMMLPSAAPNILLAAALNRRSNSLQPPYGKTVFFTLGYLLIWLIFSLLATAVQVIMELNGLLTMMMQNRQSELSALFLLAAGLWQFSATKRACLRHCRSPIEFLTRYRQPGNWGAFSMGAKHGTYCLGCCWFLMGLLFVGGIMNLLWVAGLAGFVLVEKVFSRGAWLSHTAGVLLITAGLVLLII